MAKVAKKKKAKKKAVEAPKKVSGVDISGLSANKLVLLEEEIREHRQKTNEAAEKAARKQLAESGQLETLKKQWAAINKEFKGLSKSFSFELLVPLKFTVSCESDDSLHDCWVDDADDLFGFHVEGKINNAGGNLTKKQASTLAVGLEDVLANACDVVLDVIPADLLAQHQDFYKRFKEFDKGLEKLGISSEDLEE